MGRKGDLLREQKTKRVVYTFTAEQLRARDEAMKAAWRKDAAARMTDHARELEEKIERDVRQRTNELWNDREARFRTGYRMGDALAMASAMMSVTIKVLIEDFKWKPIPDRPRGRKTRIQRFAEAVTEEMNRISTDDDIDIIRFASEIEDKYGVSFMMEDDDEQEGDG